MGRAGIRQINTLCTWSYRSRAEGVRCGLVGRVAVRPVAEELAGQGVGRGPRPTRRPVRKGGSRRGRPRALRSGTPPRIVGESSGGSVRGGLLRLGLGTQTGDELSGLGQGHDLLVVVGL